MKKTFNFFLAIITATAMVCSCDPSQNDPVTPPADTENEGEQSGTEDQIQVTDLSATATANCYMVNAAGTYKIKAVKGNSSDSVGEVASAELLWTDNVFANFEGVVTSTSVSYADGYVQFTTTGTDGNAILAAKDASGNILWSWHIWAIAEVPEVQLGGLTVQKHQLGYIHWADNDAFGWGLLYQWGRKDPFAINWAKQPAPTDIFATAVSVSDEGVIGTDGTAMAYSIAHPNHFIKGNDTTCDWYAATAENQNRSLWAETKTINDPCPAGYIVAPSTMFQGIQDVAADVTDTRHAMVCDGVDFLYSGYINYNQSFAGWEYAGSWTWSRDTVTDSPFANSCYILNAIIEPAKGWYRGTAMSVRCAKQ